MYLKGMFQVKEVHGESGHRRSVTGSQLDVVHDTKHTIMWQDCFFVLAVDRRHWHGVRTLDVQICTFHI